MTIIFKYQLEIIDENILDMPKGAKILTVQTQNDIPCVWAEVDPSQENEQRVFMLFETRQPILEINKKYIGTCHLKNNLKSNEIIFHVYERIL